MLLPCGLAANRRYDITSAAVFLPPVCYANNVLASHSRIGARKIFFYYKLHRVIICILKATK
jgi:hypothetical protein